MKKMKKLFMLKTTVVKIKALEASNKIRDGACNFYNKRNFHDATLLRASQNKVFLCSLNCAEMRQFLEDEKKR